MLRYEASVPYTDSTCHRTVQYWLHIHSGYYDFERRSKDAALIEAMSKADVLQFFRERISPSSTSRAKVSVHMQSQHISKKTAEALPEILNKASVGELSQTTKDLLSSDPLPTLSAVEAVAKDELVAASKQDKLEDVLATIRASHTPSDLGSGKIIFEDGEEVRRQMAVGPPSKPAEEYTELLAKL